MYQHLIAVGTVNLVINTEDKSSFLLQVRREFKDESGDTHTDISGIEVQVDPEYSRVDMNKIKTGVRVMVRGVVIGDENGNPAIHAGVDTPSNYWSRMTVNAYTVKVVGGGGDSETEDELIWILCGRLGRNAEMRYTPSGQAVTNFNLAVNYWTKEKGQQTLWIRCAAWGKTAENLTRLTKGSGILIDARPLITEGMWRIWTRQDGTPGCSFEATIAHARFIDKLETSAAIPHQV